MQPKIPVSVSAELKVRVENFVGAVKACINPPASAALNSSTICRIAIEEMVDRYESAPDKMARRLGFSPSKPK